jgi:hypothetical protein
MQSFFHEPAQQADRVAQLDRYLPQKIRLQIEQNYYAKVNEQAQLDQVARNEEFLSNPLHFTFRKDRKDNRGDEKTGR